MFLPYEFSFFEKLFEMESGYVLDFSNGTFNYFIRDSVGIDVYDDGFLRNVEKILFKRVALQWKNTKFALTMFNL